MIKPKKQQDFVYFQWESAILWWLKCNKVKQSSALYKLAATNGIKNGEKTQNKESMWTRAHNTWINIRPWFPILTNAGTFIHFIQWRTPDTLENCWTHAFFVLVLQKWKQSWSESLAQTNTCWKKRERMWVRGQGQRSRRHRS